MTVQTESPEQVARQLRRLVIEMTTEAASGHPSSALSATDIMAVLYFETLNIRPEQPDWPERDRFVLSKGHACPILYACLALRGFFPVDLLPTFRKLHSPLQGHPDLKKLPAGVEASTGSLGQGFATSIGMALGGKLDRKDFRVYALLGDGELQEGIVWEAAMAAAHYKLDNLTAIVDLNGLQTDGTIWDVMSPAPVPDKWRAFGWHTLVIDGHDYSQIRGALREAKETLGKPTVIIAQTVKGKGVSFMENDYDWHGKPANREQAEQALAELEGA